VVSHYHITERAESSAKAVPPASAYHQSGQYSVWHRKVGIVPGMKVSSCRYRWQLRNKALWRPSVCEGRESGRRLLVMLVSCTSRSTWTAQRGNLPAGTNVLSAMGLENFVEEVQVLGRDLVDKVRDLIHEGNVQRIVVKDEHGNTFVEIPVTIAAVGAIVSPLLAAMGAISALVAKFTIVVVRSEPKAPGGGPSGA